MFYKLNIDLLFAYLLTNVAQQIFDDNRREYGDGLKKFEPNDLNNALMLDLSKLDKETELRIIELYHNYRFSAINNRIDENYLNEINKILTKKYKA